jgi:hypothetical protein
LFGRSLGTTFLLCLSSFILSCESSFADFPPVIGASISDCFAHAFGAGSNGISFTFGFIFVRVLAFQSFANTDLIILLGLFFDCINRPTAFCVNPFPISATPDQKCPVTNFHIPHTIFPNHSMVHTLS